MERLLLSYGERLSGGFFLHYVGHGSSDACSTCKPHMSHK